MKRLCLCGCGFEVVCGNKYIHGHNRRGLASCTHETRWSMKYDRCTECGSDVRKHVGNGLCTRCHRLSRYTLKKELKIPKWSTKHKHCVECGRIDRPHAANGRCGTCYVNQLNRKKGVVKRNFGQWSWYYDKCQKCGTTKRPHVKNGLCYDCCMESKRFVENISLVECPVCHVKVETLTQHLSMRAKKCKKHSKYQYNYLKEYFDGEFSLGEISKKLGMDRHSITRQFVKYFGEKETEERNERARRWNVSKAAVINFNYRNRRGTVIEHDSPNQGIIKMRSKIEGIYADFLDAENKNWWYERDHFTYVDKVGIKRTYTPDFYLSEENKYIEVKGKNLLDEDDLHKINCLREQGISIEVVEF